MPDYRPLTAKQAKDWSDSIIKSRRDSMRRIVSNHIYERIRDAVADGLFSVKISMDAAYKESFAELVKELKDAGYEVISPTKPMLCKITVSWR